jgi:glutamine synthetase
MSKPVTTSSGSGAHMNHSLYSQGGENLFFDPDQSDGLSDLSRWFIGGQIAHAEALCALVNPTVNSYKRLQPYSFAPTTASWGYEHRGAMIRVPHKRGDATRLENRLPGADTNPYLTLAAILAAGLDGIRNRIEPPAPLVNQDAYTAEAKRLPRTLPTALQALAEDALFRTWLGEEFVHHFIALRQAEYERFHAHVTDWELKEYMDLF